MNRRMIVRVIDVANLGQTKLTNLLARLCGLFITPKRVRREATALIEKLGPEGALVAVRDKHRMAQVVDAENDERHWSVVLREIERQTEYEDQTDIAGPIGHP